MTAFASTLVEGRFDSRRVSAEVEYRLLLPQGVSGPLPLIQHLHGAMSSAASLERARPAYEAAWAAGTLPPAVVACASTPTLDGFYIDQAGGPQWETLVAEELPELVGRAHPLTGRWAALGFSMGGYGALKLAFRRPQHCVAVAALCPAIFPAETADAVPERNRPSVLGELNRAMGADAATYAENSIHALLRRNLGAIRAATPAIFLDCGEVDEFGLFDGASYLHGLLDELAVPHRFVPVAGAGHADAHAVRRQDEAIAFVGAALRAG